MIYYYALAVTLSLFSFMESVVNSKFMRPIVIFYSFILLAFFAGLRSDVYDDHGSYRVLFGETPDLIQLIEAGGSYAYYGVKREYLYLLLGSIIKLFTDNSIYNFLAVAFLAVGINIYCYKKFSPYVLISILFYFSHAFLYKEMAQIRTGLACAIVLLSVLYIQRRQLIHFLVTVFVAGFIHIGAFVVLPFYWICNISFSKKTFYFFLFLGFIVAQFNWLGEFLRFLSSLNMLPARVVMYIYLQQSNYDVGITNPMTIKQILICLIAINYKDFLSARLTYFYPLLVMYVFSTVWLLAFHEFAILCVRIATYLSIGDPIIIPSFVLLVKEKRTALVGIIFLAWIVLFINLIKQGFPPYQSLLFST